MSKYMKKPVVIDAIQWTKENDVELEHWLSKEKSVELEIDDHLYVAGVGTPYISKIQIKTLEGTMEASYGDYIIKGINGEIYPCKPDIFEKTYEQPKQYLKWEDLKFTYDEQKIKVKLNGENYTVVYFISPAYYGHNRYEYVGILKDDNIVVYSINGYLYTAYLLKQFFNNLHLEVIDNE